MRIPFRLGRTLALVVAPLVLTAGAPDPVGPLLGAPGRQVPATASVLPPVAEAAARPPSARPERRARKRHPKTTRRAQNPYAAFARRRGKRPWWNRRSGIRDAEWVYPNFPTACYQADRAAGGVNASAWQVLWVYPDNQVDDHARYLRDVRLVARGAQSLFAASARRYLRDQQQLFARSLAPRFVTTGSCEADVRPVAVPAGVYHQGMVWHGSPSATPFGAGTVTDWLLAHGYDAPNRKYLVFLQAPPSYTHDWAGISEDPAASAPTQAVAEAPTSDNPANYTSFSYLDITWYLSPRPAPADLAYPAQLMAHEMTHAMGAMTDEAPHESAVNPLHPTDCWDLLCYNPPTGGQTYTNGCGSPAGWEPARLARGYMRLDCNRDDYWAPATDAGQPAAAWTRTRWAVSSSSFLYGNPQPAGAQLLAHRR